jgi:hypothetical protein
MAEVKVRVTAENATRTGFQQALGEAKRFGGDAAGSIQSSFQNIGSSLKSTFAGIFAGIGIGSIVRNTISELSNIGDLAQQFGVSAESLQRIGQVASESGVSIDQVGAALGRLTRSVQAAQGGTGAQADAFRDLGLSAKELAGLSPEQAFLKLADAVAGAGDRNKAYAATIAVAGRSAGALIPILQQGSAALQEQFGLISVVSDETVNKIKQVEDAFSRLGKQITSSLGPPIAIIGQGLLAAVSVIQSGVQQAAGQITSLVLAIGQAFQGNFQGAGDILSGEVEASKQRFEDLKKTINGIFSGSSGGAAAGAGAFAEQIEQATDRASAAAARSEDNTRKQIGEQLRRLRQQGQTPEEQLAELQQRERFLSGDRGGVSEKELERLRVVEQIKTLEDQIAKDKASAAEKEKKAAEQRQQAVQRAAQSLAAEIEQRSFAALSPADQRAKIAADTAALIAGAESGAISPADAAQRALELQRREDALLGAANGFTGSEGASAFQRVGLATNEFFDTRTKKDPADETRRAAEFVKQILDIIKKGEPLVLPGTSS